MNGKNVKKTLTTTKDSVDSDSSVKKKQPVAKKPTAVKEVKKTVKKPLTTATDTSSDSGKKTKTVKKKSRKGRK